jgi:dTDP-4-amino-4,6-dideoxygalactose transaminase
MLTLQSRHRLDIRFRDFAYALAACAWAHSAERLTTGLEAAWSPGGQGLACRSVRSGFHLLLSALDLPAGSEVLVSAITHPDMIRILEAHRLVAVPVGRPESEARAAARMMGGLVFLPAYPELSGRSFARLVAALERSGFKPSAWPETASRRLRQA